MNTGLTNYPRNFPFLFNNYFPNQFPFQFFNPQSLIVPDLITNKNLTANNSKASNCCCNCTHNS